MLYRRCKRKETDTSAFEKGIMTAGEKCVTVSTLSLSLLVQAFSLCICMPLIKRSEEEGEEEKARSNLSKIIQKPRD